MIFFEHKGNFNKTNKFLKKIEERKFFKELDSYGQKGVRVLANATPKDTGLTASMWGYRVEIDKDKASISWTNSNVNRGVPIVILIQYGHATGTGGYVYGRDFINPAMRTVLDEVIDNIWKEVTLE